MNKSVKILFTNHLLNPHAKQLMFCRFLCTGTKQKVEQKTKKNEKLVKIAIIGVPNAGKSTFINNLINHRVCPTSNKVHTTRTFSKAICVKNNSQIILFDTPGLVTPKEMKKHNLENSFQSSSRHSIQHSDLIGVLHDVSNSWCRNQLHPTVIDILEAYPKVPSILILNKIDTLKSKRILLDITKNLTENTLVPKGMKAKKETVDKNLGMTTEKPPTSQKPTGWPNFSEVFMISSLTGDGMSKVMTYILGQTKQQNWEYDANEFTDQPPEELIVQSVRARLLDYIPQELPYMLKSQIEYYTVEKGQIFASVQVTCPTERIERLVCGEGNGKLKQITERVTSDLVETFGQPVSLTISTVAAKKNTK